MSRCFPFPPPGYAPSRASEESLIESIKFPKERVKSKLKERKEKSKEQKKGSSKEQKEKRSEKKEKLKEKKDKSVHVQNLLGEIPFSCSKPELLSKGSKAEPEQLEGSSVTEEHGNPTCLLAPSTSSDSTDNNSKKRKLCSSPAEVTKGHGKIIRIRLPLKKPKIEQQPCSTSEKTNVASQNKNTFCSSIRNDRDQICSTPQPFETRETPKPSMVNMTPMQRAEFEYTNLMDSLVSPQLLDDADDLDWLLKGKSGESSAEKKESSAEKKLAAANNGLASSVSWGLWPRAQYLQEVDIYALPFTVPF